jgi:hypothetical protein
MRYFVKESLLFLGAIAGAVVGLYLEMSDTWTGPHMVVVLAGALVGLLLGGVTMQFFKH